MTFNSYIKTLRFLQRTLFTGYTLAIIIAVTLYWMEIVPLLPETQDNFLIDVGIVALTFSGVFSAFYFFQTLLLRQNKRHSLARKLSAFKTTYFIRLAIIEAIGMIAIVLFIVSLSMIALMSSIIVAVILGLLKPSKKEMIRILRLTPSQEAQIMSKKAAISDIRNELFKDRMN